MPIHEEWSAWSEPVEDRFDETDEIEAAGFIPSTVDY
jgi:hypothetical protein